MIKQLEPHVANLIAAGEVVERPASVVKELMENAIDAGAAHITVEIAHGGMSLIRVTDDGSGIPAEQAPTAFLRHATSKIATEYDLEAIGTLGFRGEALAAIAAVSRIELLTRTTAEPLGTALSLAGGLVTQQEEAGCPTGTTMAVRDLFFNTPARLKFMKRDQAEGAAVFAVVQQEALAHPEVSVKFIRDGRQDLLTPGDGALKSAMYAVFGRDIALGFLPVSGTGEDMEAEGFASMPVCCRGSRSYQHFFVNGRYVKSRTMQAAVEEAYKNQKMVGKFPGCVIRLTCKLSSVDVNVHPTKTEVKFLREQQVFSTVYHAVLSALDRDRTRPSVLAEHASPLAGESRSESIQTKPIPVKPAQAELIQTKAVPPQPTQTKLVSVQPTQTKPEPVTPISAKLAQTEPPAVHPLSVSAREGAIFPLHAFAAPKTDSMRRFKPATRAVDITPPGDDFEPEFSTESEKIVEVSGISRDVKPPQDPPEPVLTQETETEPWVIRGELFHTYIVVEQGETALLIDKHAAHERMNFDRLRAQGYRPMLQTLLIPVTLRPAPPERVVLLEHLTLLEEFGFALEEFGGDTLVVRQAPADVPEGEIESALLELARRLLTTGTADPAGARDELLHTIACKAAIKGGWKNGQQELERVAEAVLRGEVKYCPHGRPVAIELSKKQLEKQFKRA